MGSPDRPQPSERLRNLNDGLMTLSKVLTRHSRSSGVKVRRINFYDVAFSSLGDFADLPPESFPKFDPIRSNADITSLLRFAGTYHRDGLEEARKVADEREEIRVQVRIADPRNPFVKELLGLPDGLGQNCLIETSLLGIVGPNDNPFSGGPQRLPGIVEIKRGQDRIPVVVMVGYRSGDQAVFILHEGYYQAGQPAASPEERIAQLLPRCEIAPVASVS